MYEHYSPPAEPRTRLDRFSVWFEDLAVKLFFCVLIGLGALIFTKTAISLIFLFI